VDLNLVAHCHFQNEVSADQGLNQQELLPLSNQGMQLKKEVYIRIFHGLIIYKKRAGKPALFI
jgi:hypothetical protein